MYEELCALVDHLVRQRQEDLRAGAHMEDGGGGWHSGVSDGLDDLGDKFLNTGNQDE